MTIFDEIQASIARLAEEGQRLLQKYRPALSAIEARFGVPATIVLAIWGRETDYGRYTPHTLMARARTKGLVILADELREIEDADPQGHRHPRFKKSDDATAVLLRLA